MATVHLDHAAWAKEKSMQRARRRKAKRDIVSCKDAVNAELEVHPPAPLVASFVASACASRVVIDLGYLECQNAWEKKSLSHQIRECYGMLKRMRDPFGLHVTGLSDGFHALLKMLCCEQWNVGFHHADLNDVFSHEEMVYLSPDATDALSVLEPSTVYVIGGLVDRTRIRGASQHRASAIGVRSVRLPLAEHGFQGIPRDLNVTTVFKVLTLVSTGMPWPAALTEAIPRRTKRVGHHVAGKFEGARDCADAFIEQLDHA